MAFSPAFISACIVDPIRYLYHIYAPEELRWTSDHMKSMIEIDTINNFNKEKIQAKPRILISRGGYEKNHTGLSDNLTESKGPYQLKGLHDETRMILVNGMAQILIQARNEGTCEKICDLTEHFLQWTSPFLCNTYGFKMFGFPLQVSPCTPNKEDQEIFEISIGVPWMKEEHWNVKDDALKLKGFSLLVSKQ